MIPIARRPEPRIDEPDGAEIGELPGRASLAARWSVWIVMLLWVTGCSIEAERPRQGQAFPVPPQIVVSIAPYGSVEQALADVDNVDWDRDAERVQAVTLAYAAQELRQHLGLAGIAASFAPPDAGVGRPSIVLAVHGQSSDHPSLISADPTVDYASLGDQGYVIVPDRGQVFVTANTRVGLLHGVYGLLEELGYAWYDPYDARIPDAAALALPRTWRRIQEVPRVPLRGFWIYGGQPTPDEFAIWLARNKFNLGGTPRLPLQRLLGIKGWGGGHGLLQEEFSRPGLFEQHPDWFAEVNGVRRPVAPTGGYFNPAFVSAEAAAYFAERMVQRLEAGDLRGIDLLNIWPTDDRFNQFDQSAAARALGNETDNLLLFYANVCARLREARAGRRLSRPVTVAGISYFLTMTPPSSASVVAALQDADYLHLFYPIDRDWSGQFDTGLVDRDSNRKILKDMDAWRSLFALKYGVVEYHNVSAFGAVALTDHLNLPANHSILGDGRRELYAYMHPLLRNPGPRRLTNALQARLAWRDASTIESTTSLEERAELVTQDYFVRRYGEHAAEWRAIYDLTARSVENSKEMFGINSLSWLLLQPFLWAEPFYTPGEVAGLVGRYRSGGVQDLPAAFSGLVTERATFRGLDESLALQVQARGRWQAVAEGPMDSATRARIESDVAWLEATASRYRLMAASIDVAMSRSSGLDESVARERVAAEVAILAGSPVLRDTISPVDQSGFLDLHRKLANLP
jgi:hypothetical protein